MEAGAARLGRVMIKSFLTWSSVALAGWMGASFVAPADPADFARGMVPPGHGDSHRLGEVKGSSVELPSWDAAKSEERSPLLFVVASVE